MVGLFAAIGRSLDAEGWIMWFRLLGDIPLPSLDYAIARWLTETDSGFPSIAAIRKLAIEHQRGPTLGAAEAFLIVRVAMKQRCPYYEPAEFMKLLPSLVRDAVAACGGPIWLAELRADQRTTYLAQFRRAYESFAASESRTRRLPEALRPLVAGSTLQPAIARLADAMSVPPQVCAALGAG
jgi:hypothetical protein